MDKNNYKNKKFEDNLGYSIGKIMKLFDHFSAARVPYERLWKLLDSYDNGDFWKYVAKVLPKYAIKPDHNWVSHVKDNYCNSLYVGSYRGEVFCREYQNEQTTLEINEFLKYIFDKIQFGSLQQKAGERASLLNFGAIEFGWNSDIIDGSKNNLFTGNVEAKFIDNFSLFLDPSTIDYQKGRAIFIAEEVNLAELVSEPRFKERIKLYLELIKENGSSSLYSPRDYGKGYNDTRNKQRDDNTVRLLTCYYKHFDKENMIVRLDKIWIIDDGFVLDIQKGLLPKEFPVKILYCYRPTKDPYGTPIGKKILNNAITINLLDAIDSTMIFKAIERSKVVSRKAGINEAAFAKDGDAPNKLWVVDGDPNNVVKYVDLPDLPNDRHLLKERLEQSIMRMSGIDDTYTGTDTNSVQTTGGMDIMNQRLSLRDNTKISTLKDFILGVTEYIMKLFLEHSGNKKFPKYNKYNEFEGMVEIPFEKMREQNVSFDFTCDITPNLPNNVQRRQETYNIMMEKQMQYRYDPPLITSEEWLAAMDFPDKFKILKRIRDQRLADDVEDIEAELINYSGLVEQGVRPDAAVKMLANERQIKRDNPGLGNTGNANSFQNRQSG